MGCSGFQKAILSGSLSTENALENHWYNIRETENGIFLILLASEAEGEIEERVVGACGSEVRADVVAGGRAGREEGLLGFSIFLGLRVKGRGEKGKWGSVEGEAVGRSGMGFGRRRWQRKTAGGTENQGIGGSVFPGEGGEEGCRRRRGKGRRRRQSVFYASLSPAVKGENGREIRGNGRGEKGVLEEEGEKGKAAG